MSELKLYQRKPEIVKAVQWFPGVEIEGVNERKVGDVIFGVVLDHFGYGLLLRSSQWLVYFLDSDRPEIVGDIAFEETYIPFEGGLPCDQT